MDLPGKFVCDGEAMNAFVAESFLGAIATCINGMVSLETIV